MSSNRVAGSFVPSTYYLRHMKKTICIGLLLLLLCPVAIAQSVNGIRGTVTDKQSAVPLSFAKVVVLHTQPLLGALTDSSGAFYLHDIPSGRYDLEISYLGYHTVFVPEVWVGSGKQTELTINMTENTSPLSEVVVKPVIHKHQSLNPQALVSSRMLSVEEASRYAGGFDDPARLASAFAGVASNSGSNGIIVRGNSPRFLQWRMEGVEIPSPNHFNDLRAFGGGVLTALSSQMLANSDFMTGAFPAEYNNALSGVFDMNLRKGNPAKRETTLQFGLIGLEATQEGPFKKGSKSSYVWNYRYSTLGLLAPVLPDGAETIRYQDISFKLNFPTKKAGTFSVWGVGLIDGANASPKKDTTKRLYYDDSRKDDIALLTGAGGITHKLFLNNNIYVHTVLAAATNTTDWKTRALTATEELVPYSNITNTTRDYTLSSYVNKKFSVFHTNKTGVRVRYMNYSLKLNKAVNVGDIPTEIVNASGASVLSSAFTSSSFALTNSFQLTAGITAQYFSLNSHYTIEPRIAMLKAIGANHTVGIAYGLHSRTEGVSFYYNNSLTTGEKAVNKNLDFTKAHHLVFTYSVRVSESIQVKVEPYMQLLFDVPVAEGSSFSSINLQSDWFFAQKLVNKGKGKNYGIDVTLEKYMSKGFYYMITASVFDALYTGGDGVWRNSRFNRNVVTNVLAGKEWKVGKSKQNLFSLNGRVTVQGGERYSPFDVTATIKKKEVVYDESRAYSRQTNPMVNVHVTIAFKKNTRKRSGEIALKIVNLTQQPDFYGYQYNFRTGGIDQDVETILLPNLYYKIQF